VYADKFTYTKESLQEKLSISEEEAERILELTRRGSASHSAWLMFMYSRLLLARDLLSDDGVIFISIDDNEQANLKLICDDVFGEENLMGTMIWRRRTSSALADNNFSTDHEYVVTYQRANAEEFKGIEKDFKGYSNPDNDPRGPWVLGDLTVGMTASMRPNQAYDLIDPISKKVFPFNPNRVWAYVPESMGRLIEENRVYFPSDGSKRPMLKRFQNELKSSHNPMSSIILDKVGLNTEATRLQQEIFGQNIFDYSKPMSLLTTLIPQVVKEGEIILDFFSGSGTTAHAVLELNSKANKPSRFISVQLPEPLNPEIDSQKIAFDFLSSHNLPTTLDYIGIERIKRAAALIRASHPEKELDLGFRHFVLEEPNTQTLDKLEHFDPQALLADTSLLEAFGKETILSTWLNADGYGLCSQAQNIDLAGYTAYYCQKHLYFIHEGFGEESLKALVALFEADAHFNPENLVLFGYSFPQWSINEMLEKNLKVLQDGERQQRINFSVRY
jgi:type III restriction enzyme/adenine-specific DNA-methyltransferase